MRFTVTDSRNKPKDKVSKMKYGYTEEYYTYDSETNSYAWESEYKIIEKYSKIPSELLEEWLDSVMEYVNEYNKKVIQDVTFKIEQSRTNAMYYTYKYINGVFIEEGWRDFGMIPNKDIDAWVDAVVEYYNKKSIQLPRFKTKNILNEIAKTRNSGTTLFDTDTSGTVPSIPNAIAMSVSDPCKFPSTLMRSVKTGLTGPLDKMRNLISGARKKINVELSISTDDFNTAVGQTMDPVTNTIERQLNDRTDKDDLQSEYISKKHANTITDMKTLLEDDDSQDVNSNDDGNAQGEEAVLVSNNIKHEIPAWAAEKIAAAMKERFGHNAAPSQDILSRFNSHKDYFTKVFKKYGVPEQLIVLSIIESDVKNISTENSATAKGMWQFVRLSAQQYNLLKLQLKPGLGDNYNKYSSKDYDIISSYDKRDQLEPSTEAAAKLLRDIRKGRKKIYNWLLVAAGYNWGGGSVSNAITKAGNGADFWEVWKKMPLETRNYVCLTIGLNQYFGMSTDPLFE